MGFVDLIFPKTCLECGSQGSYICDRCLKKVLLSRACCAYCYKPSIDGATHYSCLKRFGLDGVTSIWRHEGAVRRAILALKYKFATEIVGELSKIASDALLKYNIFVPKTELLVPIPMFWYRENFRGFNQSLELGKRIAESWGVDFEAKLLVKKKDTGSQTQLSGEGRRKNLTKSFEVNKSYQGKLPKSVILFDDVFTTGSTLNEASNVLKKAGAEYVWGLTLSR